MSPPQPPSAPALRVQPWSAARFRAAAALVVLLAGAVIGYLFWEAEARYRREAADTLQRTAERSLQLATLVAAQADVLARSVDAMLLRLRRDSVLDRATFRESTTGLANFLPDGGLLAVQVLDPSGTTLHSTRPQDGEAGLVARSALLSHGGGDDRLVIGVPAMDRAAKQWAIAFTRPVLEGGRLRGVLAAAVSPEYFAAGLRRAQLEPNDTIALFDAGGAYLARASRMDEVLGRSLAARPFLGPDAAARGTVRLRAQLDGSDRIFGWQRVGATAMIAVVGLDVRDSLARAEWRRSGARKDAAWAALGVLALSASILVALAAIARRQRALQDSLSALVRAGERVRRAEERLGDAVETLDENVIVTDPDDRISILNAAARRANPALADRAVGMPYEDFLREGVALGYYPEAAGCEADWLAARRAHRLAGGEPRIVARQDGAWYRVSDRRLRDGGRVTIALDVTALREANEQLRLHLAAFEALLRNLSGAAYRCRNDRDWTLDYISEGCVDITGYRADELIGNRVRSLGSLIHPQDAPGLWERCQRALAAREPHHNEYRIVGRDGGVRWVWDQAQGIHDESGRLVRIEGLLTDITKRKELELALLELNEQLERRVDERTGELRAALREQESFSYSVSHDLRAPLRAINGFASILLEDHAPALAEDARALLRRVADNAVRMGELVDGVLELARLGRLPVARAPVDMQALVASVLEQLAGAGLPEGAVAIAPLPPAQGDATLLRQVWQNLIANALKFSAGRRDARIEVGAEAAPGGGFRYHVRDNGVGFDMAYADKLFGLFQRLYGMDEFAGTGLGLAIVKRAVERHRGEVWAESKPGQGATFWFWLPA